MVVIVNLKSLWGRTNTWNCFDYKMHMTCVSLCCTEQDQKMKSYLFFLVIAVSSLVASPQTQTCPTDHFSAIFAGTVDTVSSGIRGFGNTDPELKFFKEILGFRDDAIQHTIGPL